MGIFSGIKDNYKKSEAAVIIQNLLAQQAQVGLFSGDPAKTANSLVENAWQAKPDMFNGGFGQRPFKLSVAAFSLALGAKMVDLYHEDRNPFMISLGSLLQEVEVNGALYPFNGIDNTLLEASMNMYMEMADEFDDSPLGEQAEAILSAGISNEHVVEEPGHKGSCERCGAKTRINYGDAYHTYCKNCM
jgi:hypothetical protein